MILDEPTLVRLGVICGEIDAFNGLIAGLLDGEGVGNGDVVVLSLPLPLRAAEVTEADPFVEVTTWCTGAATAFANCTSDSTFTFPEIASTCAAS